MRIQWLAPLVLLAACPRTSNVGGVRDGERRAAPSTGGAVKGSDVASREALPAGQWEQPCAMPPAPEDVVVRIDRNVVPVDQPAVHEEGEVTAEGRCTDGVAACARVDKERLGRLYRLVRTAAGVRHTTPATSPHYGSRSISVRWRGGACEFGDASSAPVDIEDKKIFDAAFHAVADVVAAKRDGG